MKTSVLLMTPGPLLSTAPWQFHNENLLGSWRNWSILGLACDTKNLENLGGSIESKLKNKMFLSAMQLGSCDTWLS